MKRGLVTLVITLIQIQLAYTQPYISFFNKTDEDNAQKYRWNLGSRHLTPTRAFEIERKWRFDPEPDGGVRPPTLPRHPVTFNKSPTSWKPWIPNGAISQPPGPPKSASLVYQQERPSIPLRNIYTPPPRVQTPPPPAPPSQHGNEDDYSYAELLDYLELEELQKDYDISMEDLLKIVQEIEQDYDLPLINPNTTENQTQQEPKVLPLYEWEELPSDTNIEYDTDTEPEKRQIENNIPKLAPEVEIIPDFHEDYQNDDESVETIEPTTVKNQNYNKSLLPESITVPTTVSSGTGNKKNETTHNHDKNLPSLHNLFSNVDLVSKKPFYKATTSIPRLEDLFQRTTHRTRPTTKDKEFFITPRPPKPEIIPIKDDITTAKQNTTENAIKSEPKTKLTETSTKPVQRTDSLEDALNNFDLQNIDEEELAKLVYKYTHPENYESSKQDQLEDPFMSLTPKYDQELKQKMEAEINKTQNKTNNTKPVEINNTEDKIQTSIDSKPEQNKTVPKQRPESFSDVLENLDPESLSEEELTRLVEQYTNPHAAVKPILSSTTSTTTTTTTTTTKPTTTATKSNKLPSLTDLINEGSIEKLSIEEITKLVNKYTEPEKNNQSNNGSTPKIKGIVFPKSTKRKNKRPNPWLRPPMLAISTSPTKNIKQQTDKVLPHLGPPDKTHGNVGLRHPIPSNKEKKQFNRPDVRYRQSVSEYGYRGRPMITSRITSSTEDPHEGLKDKSRHFGVFGVNMNITSYDDDDDYDDTDVVYEYEDVQDNTKSAIYASSVLGGLALVFFIVLLFVCRWRQIAWRKLSKDRIPDSNSSLPTVSPKPVRKAETQSGLWTLLRKSKREVERSNSVTSSEDPS